MRINESCYVGMELGTKRSTTLSLAQVILKESETERAERRGGNRIGNFRFRRVPIRKNPNLEQRFYFPISEFPISDFSGDFTFRFRINLLEIGNSDFRSDFHFRKIFEFFPNIFSEFSEFFDFFFRIFHFFFSNFPIFFRNFRIFFRKFPKIIYIYIKF